jgi:hypothetical protein
MRVHLFKNEHVYNLALLDFLAAHFDLSDHLFIFQCRRSGVDLPVDDKHVLYLPGYANLIKIKRLISDCERVYFHLLPMGPVIFFWFLHKTVFLKAVWVYWGADVYEYRKRHSGLKHFLYHLARKRIIRLIPDIAGYLEGDYNLIREHYPTGAKYHHVIYPIPTNFEMCDRLMKKQGRESAQTIVLVGNSGNESNRHLEAFRLLEKFHSNGFLILCPLSYGAKKASYVQEVIREGNRIFGNNFRPVVDFMPPDKYLEMLNEVDVAVMNHDRQQGLGNTLSLLYLGKKVFLRPETTSYGYFQDKQVRVFDINSIKDLSTDDFARISGSDCLRNRDILRNEFSDANYRRNWGAILELQGRS